MRQAAHIARLGQVEIKPASLEKPIRNHFLADCGLLVSLLGFGICSAD